MNISLKRGDTYSTVVEVILVTETDGVKVESAFDLTGYTALFTAKKNANIPDASATIQKSLTVDEELGTITFALDETDTDFVGVLVYDVQIMNEADREVHTVLDGTLTIKNDVTKTTLPAIP